MRIPDIHYLNKEKSFNLLPSWSDYQKFINDQHAQIHELTESIDGWHAPGDTVKLYELGFFRGEVILEIGVWAGRSAVAQLLGAVSNPERKHPPQYFGIDIDKNSLVRTYDTLKRFNLDQYAFLFHGNLEQFISAINICPTTVFVDGDHRYEGIKKDLECLSQILAPQTTVLCHDYSVERNDHHEFGVKQACNEWEEQGYASFIGRFGVSALYLTADKCEGFRGGLSRRNFHAAQKIMQDNFLK
ncbi:MAG: class I SAM-dependent methyltransferase [Candidatus Dadabacteria bacterium]|nr:MAG: class I SAM-dependent methyltransferase [Candidatus Dadabacteria bacterium]